MKFYDQMLFIKLNCYFKKSSRQFSCDIYLTNNSGQPYSTHIWQTKKFLNQFFFPNLKQLFKANILVQYHAFKIVFELKTILLVFGHQPKNVLQLEIELEVLKLVARNDQFGTKSFISFPLNFLPNLYHKNYLLFLYSLEIFLTTFFITLYLNKL